MGVVIFPRKTDRPGPISSICSGAFRPMLWVNSDTGVEVIVDESFVQRRLLSPPNPKGGGSQNTRTPQRSYVLVPPLMVGTLPPMNREFVETTSRRRGN